MSFRCVLASGNAGKLKEMNSLLDGLGWTVESQSALGVESPPETGLTFVENALIKARHASDVTGLPAIADDSGIEVDVLDGAPGIYSARYAGEDASDEANLQKLLDTLADYPESSWSARFQCVVVMMRHALDPTPIICPGTWEGQVVPVPRGANGFGYDPIFLDPTSGHTAAELDSERKNRISHRAKALLALRARLGHPVDEA